MKKYFATEWRKDDISVWNHALFSKTSTYLRKIGSLAHRDQSWIWFDNEQYSLNIPKIEDTSFEINAGLTHTNNLNSIFFIGNRFFELISLSNYSMQILV